MKHGRRILYGADVVADIEVPMNLHRVQIEHDLRTILLKLRQHYLRAPGNAKELGPVLRKSFSGVLTLLRHLVIAFGEEPPVAAHDIVARAVALTDSSMTAFDAILKLRETGDFHGEIVPVYGAYLKALRKLWMRWSIISQAGMAARQGCTFVNPTDSSGYEERSDSFNYLGGHRADAGEFVYQPQESNGREARGVNAAWAQVDVVLQRRAT